VSFGYNHFMSYFFRELFSANRGLWIAAAIAVAWFIAIFDLFTASQPGALFGGKWFKATVTLTVISPILYFLGRTIFAAGMRKELRKMEESTARYEARREREIRRILEKDPEFATHCYECIFIKDNTLSCSRPLARKAADQRVKEIPIGEREYCLYWSPKFNQD
jgi:hypothetical protein